MAPLAALIPAVVQGVGAIGSAVASGVGTAATAAGSALASGASAVGSAAAGLTLAEGVGLAGTAASALGGVAAAQAGKQASEYEAAQLRKQAPDEIAAAQREALQEQDRARLLASKARAQAAGSGTSGGNITDIIAGIYDRGAAGSDHAMYLGQSRAAGLRDKAAAVKVKGQSDYIGGLIGTGADTAKDFYTIRKGMYK